MIAISVDGRSVQVPAWISLLEACDRAGIYIPRLCAHAGRWAPLPPEGIRDLGVVECGLCVVEVDRGEVPARAGARDSAPRSEKTLRLACRTEVFAGMKVRTVGDDLTSLRRRRLAAIMAGHPQVCLSCPDRDGCARVTCTFGHPPEAHCCDELGRCEIGELYLYLGLQDGSVDLDEGAPSGRRGAPRESIVEGRIRRESGLCVGCGRCLLVCLHTEMGGGALEWGPEGRVRAKKGSLRASGCTFCGQCVMVCPSGAFTAPGEAGAAWLQVRRRRAGSLSGARPPESRQRLEKAVVAAVPRQPGVFRLFDGCGRVLLISGVADLNEGLAGALAGSIAPTAEYFTTEVDQMYTQRESELLTTYTRQYGGLPPANDFDDDLYD